MKLSNERGLMHITINGTSKPLASQNLSDIVTGYCKNPKHVITELNGSIIPSPQWPHTSVKDGDTLEIVTFVGGG